jgi:hypothetical protein
MVPAHDETRTKVRLPTRPLAIWVRIALIGIAAGLVGLFVVAARLDPYDADGRPLRLATHRQLGMPACNFVERFGRPCPTCGMTTAFALLMHADPIASLRANFAGTLTAVWLLAIIPWGVAAAVRGRWAFGRAAELWFLVGVIAVVALAFTRWVAVVGVPWLCGFG